MQQNEIDFQPPAIARVTDIETTGRQEDPDPRICELGFIDLDLASMELANATEILVDPDQKMPPEVMAVHHLTDEDLAGQAHVLEAWGALNEGLGDDDVVVAHNYEFERFFLPMRQRWICTYKCAVRAWPDAPGHSNQVLRYWLGLELDRDRAQPPHRALPDAYVTAHILKALLRMRPISRLIEVTAEPIIFKTMTFGKHKGMLCKDVPTDYWDWYLNKATETRDDQRENALYWFNKRTRG